MCRIKTASQSGSTTPRATLTSGWRILARAALSRPAAKSCSVYCSLARSMYFLTADFEQPTVFPISANDKPSCRAEVFRARPKFLISYFSPKSPQNHGHWYIRNLPAFSFHGIGRARFLRRSQNIAHSWWKLGRSYPDSRARLVQGTIASHGMAFSKWRGSFSTDGNPPIVRKCWSGVLGQVVARSRVLEFKPYTTAGNRARIAGNPVHGLMEYAQRLRAPYSMFAKSH